MKEENLKILGLGFRSANFYRPIAGDDGFALTRDESIILHKYYNDSQFTVEDPIIIVEKNKNEILWPVTVKDGESIKEDWLIEAGLTKDSGGVEMSESGFGKIVDAQG